MILQLRLLLLTWTLQSVATDGIRTRIVGGQTAPHGTAPYQVAVGVKTSYTGSYRYKCAGSIISKDAVLTTALCVDPKGYSNYNLDFFILVAGSNKMFYGLPFVPTKVIVHEKYDRRSNHYDIAVVRIANYFKYYPTWIQPIKLSEASSLPVGTVGLVTGWGDIDIAASTLPLYLQMLNVSIESNDNCEAAFKKSKYYSFYKASLPLENQVCAMKDKEGICYSDVGDPLVVNNELAGLASWGQLCGQGLPNVYTFAPDFRDWINTSIQ